MKTINYTETTISIISPGDRTINGLSISGDEVKLGDFIWMDSYFSEVLRGSNNKLICGSTDINSYNRYRVIRGFIPVPYFKEPEPCYKCHGTGGTQGGTLTGGGFVSGHTTVVTSTNVGGVSKVTTTTNYGPPQSIYIPGSVCKVCKAQRAKPYNATVVMYKGRVVNDR